MVSADRIYRHMHRLKCINILKWTYYRSCIIHIKSRLLTCTSCTTILKTMPVEVNSRHVHITRNGKGCWWVCGWCQVGGWWWWLGVFVRSSIEKKPFGNRFSPDCSKCLLEGKGAYCVGTGWMLWVQCSITESPCEFLGSFYHPWEHLAVCGSAVHIRQ